MLGKGVARLYQRACVDAKQEDWYAREEYLKMTYALVQRLPILHQECEQHGGNGKPTVM